MRVKISFNGRKDNRLVSVHRLVATSFIPNPENKPDVNHKDGNKSHNYVDNLEWCTKSENIQHAMKTGLKKPIYGEIHGMTEYSNDQIKHVCELLDSGIYTKKEISKLTKVSLDVINHIISKKTWTRISNNYNVNNYRRDFVKYTYQEYESVFKLLIKNEKSIYDISDETSVDAETIFKIYLHELTSIHVHKLYKKYNICNYTLTDKEYTRGITSDMINYTKVLLEKGYKYKIIERVISKKFNINEFYIHNNLKFIMKNM